MDTDPYPDPLTTRPVDDRQILLRLCRCGHRALSSGEHHIEAVSLSTQLGSPVSGPLKRPGFSGG